MRDMGSGFRRNDNSVSGVDGNFSSKRVGAHLHTALAPLMSSPLHQVDSPD